VTSIPVRVVVLGLALVVAMPAAAGPRRAIPGQAPSVPLFTALGGDDERALAEVLRFDTFDRTRVLPWRDRLAPLAEAGDPWAQI
jgi:hypothetical protein